MENSPALFTNITALFIEYARMEVELCSYCILLPNSTLVERNRWLSNHKLGIAARPPYDFLLVPLFLSIADEGGSTSGVEDPAVPSVAEVRHKDQKEADNEGCSYTDLLKDGANLK